METQGTATLVFENSVTSVYEIASLRSQWRAKGKQLIVLMQQAHYASLRMQFRSGCAGRAVEGCG